MGLLYIFPTDETELERVTITPDSITLKTYGLPMIFWGYLAAIFTVIFSMWLVTNSILPKMLTYDDFIMHLLYWLVNGTLILGPIILLGFFFYEKFLIKNKTNLTIVHRIFFIPVYFKKIELESVDAFSVNHFMDSPNIAKMNPKDETRGFENKGYFELHAKSKNKAFVIDRHSRKIDLTKMKEILSKY